MVCDFVSSTFLTARLGLKGTSWVGDSVEPRQWMENTQGVPERFVEELQRVIPVKDYSKLSYKLRESPPSGDVSFVIESFTEIVVRSHSEMTRIMVGGKILWVKNGPCH